MGRGRVLAEEADRVVHLRRAGGAVEADDVGLKAFEHGQRRANLRAKQHRPGGFQGDLGLNGNPAAGIGEFAFLGRANGVLAGGDGDLGLQQILAGFDQQHVHAALDQRLGLLAISRGHLVVADVAQRGQLGGGAHRAGDKAGLFRGRVLVGHRAGQTRRRQVQLAGAVGEAVLDQHDRVGAEAVGLDDVAAGLQEGGVNGADHLRPREHQQLVAPLMAPEILRREVVLLQIGAHRAVVNQHAPLQFCKKVRQSRS
jgi:hypothetical protein